MAKRNIVSQNEDLLCPIFFSPIDNKNPIHSFNKKSIEETVNYKSHKKHYPVHKIKKQGMGWKTENVKQPSKRYNNNPTPIRSFISYYSCK